MAADTIKKQKVRIAETNEQLERNKRRIKAIVTESKLQDNFQNLDHELQRIKLEKPELDCRIRTLQKKTDGNEFITEIQNAHKLARNCEQM